MDTATPLPSLVEWMLKRELPGLPGEFRHEKLPDGESIVHHPAPCPEPGNGLPPVMRRGPVGDPGICGCVFAGALEDLAPARFHAMVAKLFNIDETFDRARRGEQHRLGEEFPQLVALTLRHHRQHVADAYYNRDIFGAEGEPPVAITTVRDRILADWDAAIAANTVDEEALRDETIRYATRYLMARVVWEKSANTSLPVMNALQQLVWDWLGKPLTGTLADEYFSDRGETLRRHACDPLTGSNFRMRTLDEIERTARKMLEQDTLLACHVGSYAMNPFDTSEGPRPIIIWHGLRARRDSVAFGEYPEIVCAWLKDLDALRKKSFVSPPAPGGVVLPVCENPGLDSHQWETALTLWNDSFGDDDPGPYREQADAIHAAANL